jgi:hypothetical protein
VALFQNNKAVTGRRWKIDLISFLYFQLMQKRVRLLSFCSLLVLVDDLRSISLRVGISLRIE